MTRFVAAFLLLASLAGPAALAEERAQDPLEEIPLEVPILRFDPFSPPLLGLQGAETPEGAASRTRSAWTPTLTGVVMAGPRSIANLNGVILGVGEEAHGYRLLEVREGEAVFEREGRQLVMTVVPDDPPAREGEE